MKKAFINGKLHTLDEKNRVVEAVLTEDGKITALGTTDEILRGIGEAEVVDLGGRTVLPGLNDSHMHLLSYGYCKKIVNLENCTSIQQALDIISRHIEGNHIAPNAWIECAGWNEDDWEEKRSLNRQDLDKVAKNNPIYCTRICGHVNALNSLALEALGIDETTPQPSDGTFEVDENGRPTGVLVEMMHNIYDIMPPPTVEELKDILSSASLDACKAGLTSVQTDDFECLPGRSYNDVIRAYQELVEEGKLYVRVNEQCALVTPERMEQFYADGHFFGKGDSMFKIGPLKLYCDGSLGSRTAWLAEDYSDAPGVKGFGVFNKQEEFDRLVEMAHMHGMDIAAHSIGDAATNQVVTAIERAIEKQPSFAHRHGVVHGQILTEDLCNRLVKSNILAYIQPIFILYDISMAEERIGKERMKTSYNWKTLSNMGIPLPLGTDCPVESFNPFYNIYCAVTRKDLEGKPEAGWYSNEALTLEETLKNYTKTSAYASREEYIKGTLEPGKLADFVVLNQDIYSVEPGKIKDISPVMTVLGGNILYSAI